MGGVKVLDLSSAENIVIIGGGQAAAQACASLRLFGFGGQITLIGEEATLPYQRPPLSKAYMKGEMSEERLYFRPTDWYRDNDIELMLSARAAAIDRSERTVEIEGGKRVAYDGLILSTGSRPRALSLPGADLDHVYDLRDLSDVERIRPNMVAGKRLVIIGAGYIGLEAAAVACQLGLKVTVLEMSDRVLARVTSPVMSEFFESQHRAQGVDIRTGVRLASLQGGGSVNAAVLDDGTEIAADIVLVGIGILPNVELAQEAGIACANGILVDRDARTNDPCVFAAGDCTRRPLVHYGRDGRLESVHNAIEQGKLAAAAIMGRPRPNEDCPWFWSDQYDLKLQIAGLSQDYDELVVRGDPVERKFAVFY
ncbi:MAG: FAD-dependent oxidoreductase, partial [Henriciella sp.]|nr:FAD-dependent oxidoreductase [Henriciella sp.]